MYLIIRIVNWHAFSSVLMSALIAASFALLPYDGARAQNTAQQADDSSSSGRGNDGLATKGVSNGATKSIVKNISVANTNCLIIAIEYRADCIVQNLRAASQKIHKKVYNPVKVELETGANAIDEILLEYFDKKAALVKVGRKTYRAIKKEFIGEANKRVEQMMSDIASKFISSAGRSVTRKIHFKRIAKALDSNKELLRAA